MNAAVAVLERAGAWALAAAWALAMAMAMAVAPASAATSAGVAPNPAPAKAAAKTAAKTVAKSVPAAAAPGFTVAPVPAWVQPLEARLPPDLPRAPVQLLLLDRQTRLQPQGNHHFLRAVRQVNDSAGLEPASQIEIEFDPAYQQLLLHKVDLWRGDQRIDKLDRAKVKLLHRETQLERQLVDGRMTASLVLDDVRVGDRIDWAYSVVGENPVFGDRFVEMDWSQGWMGPTALYQYRLLVPAGRSIRHQAGEAQVVDGGTTPDGLRVTLFQRKLAPQFRFDPNAPASAYLRDQVQMSEFADWAEVARWADGLFAAAAQPGPQLRARAEALRQASADPAERLRQALTLVQTEVRYFGTEIGANSHAPAPAEQVLAQRFGDCKDKASLLVALAGALGLQGTPLLVSTRYQADVAGMLPSPLAFDHAIAGVTLDGKTLWLDGTRSQQTGPAAARQPVGLGFGLPARADAIALTALPGATDALRVEAEDTLRFGKLSEDVRFEARQTFYGDLAEAVRSARDSQPAAEFDKQMGAEHARLYPGLTPEGPAEVADLPDRNAVQVLQRYRLASPWRFPQQRQLVMDFSMPALMTALRLPDQTPRTLPLRLAYPGIYRQAVVFQFAEPMFQRPSASRFDDGSPQFKLGLRFAGGSDSQRVDGELQLLTDRLPAADWSRHRDQLIRLWGRLGNTMQVSALSNAQTERLRERFATLEDDLKRGRLKPATPAQRDALVRLVVLDEQLAGDRLAPRLRAEALIARGEQRDHLQRLDAARADFEQALALDPQNAEALAALAVNAQMRGADDEALARVDEALRLAPSDLAPRYTRAYAQYFRGDFAAAQAELTQILGNRSEQERSYAQVWLYLATRRAGGDGVAAIKPLLPTGDKPAWPHALLQWLAGEASFDQALAATRDEGRPDPGRLCELYFYAGEKALIDGDLALATQQLRRSVDTGVLEFTEYGMAKRELDRLARAR